MKLLVHVEKITPRVEYISQHLLGEMFGLDCELTTDSNEFDQFSGPKFSYGKTSKDGLYFNAADLLFEHGVKSFEPDHSEFNGISTFFSVNGGALPFDPFSSSFYFLSRYEEYVIAERDEHGRFQADRSLLSKVGALEIPIVDHWALMVAKKIQEHFPQIDPELRSYKDLFTVDVDNGFAYKGRGLRSKAALVKAQVKGKAEEAKERKLVLEGKAQDPYDNYARICAQVGDKNALIFFLLFAKRGANDRGADPAFPDFHEAIRTMANGAKVGIHPSYASNDEAGRMEAERRDLGAVVNKEIILSRQHFLRFDLPDSYRTLIAASIEEDHSMGYADRPGFRAGTCRPFKWYDLEKEETTDLTVVPFATMDTALADQMGLSLEAAQEKIEAIKMNVRAVNGPLVSVWHDRVLADREPYEGWWDVFKFCISQNGKVRTNKD